MMKTLMYYIRRLCLLAWVMAGLVSGCGGGGGGNNAIGAGAAVTISGTAAAGAPVVGYVAVYDSSANPQPVITQVPIQANGHYSVDITGLTAPYAFLASGAVGGRAVSYYSAATAEDAGGTINITPFTDLMIRNIAATAVDTYLANGNLANLTKVELDAKRVALTDLLAPALVAMGLSGSIDLLRATFNADSTGLDRFMDTVKVTTDAQSSNITITNILDAANTLIINTATGGVSGSLGTSGLAAADTPLDGIKQTFSALAALFANGLPDPANADLLALFSIAFQDDGGELSAFLTEITTDASLIGLKFSDVVVNSINEAGTVAQVSVVPNVAGVQVVAGNIGGAIDWQMKKVGDIWKIDGNQRIASVSVRAFAQKVTCNPANSGCTAATEYHTGLLFDIDNNALIDIAGALITGPGLPNEGVTLLAQPGASWFFIPNSQSCPGCWVMPDNVIAQLMPNSVYTVRLYDGSADLLATYSEVVPIPPVTHTAKASLAYPAITGMVNFMHLGAVTLTPAWSVPSGLIGSDLNVFVWQSDSEANQGVGVELPRQSSGTASLGLTAPPTGSWTGGVYEIDAWDAFARNLSTLYL